MKKGGNFRVSIFENLKKADEYGAEYWFARDLQKVMGYSRWEKFKKVIAKAQSACESSGLDVDDHFRATLSWMLIRSGAQRKIADIELSRFACYLIVQNGDPHKENVAIGQTYFASQTRKQDILDHMGITDRAIHWFQTTQTQEKIVREGITSDDERNQAYLAVEEKVQRSIKELDGVISDDFFTSKNGVNQIETEKPKPLNPKQMEKPILGIARGKFLKFQRNMLRKLADANGVEMKIVDYNHHGTDDLIFYVIDHHYKSVCVLSTHNISKTFLFSLRFIYEVQLAGIAIYTVNDLAEPAGFTELSKEQYRQLWEKFGGDWKVALGVSWWKPYYKNETE
jgi:hypothetical protein